MLLILTVMFACFSASWIATAAACIFGTGRVSSVSSKPPARPASASSFLAVSTLRGYRS